LLDKDAAPRGDLYCRRFDTLMIFQLKYSPSFVEVPALGLYSELDAANTHCHTKFP